MCFLIFHLKKEIGKLVFFKKNRPIEYFINKMRTIAMKKHKSQKAVKCLVVSVLFELQDAIINYCRP